MTLEADPLKALPTGPSCERSRLRLFVGGLRDADSNFAEASTLHPDDMTEWPAARKGGVPISG